MKQRQLNYNLCCNYCGTYYQLNYDVINDEYICKECLEAETNEAEYSDDYLSQDEERREQRTLEHNKEMKRGY